MYSSFDKTTAYLASSTNGDDIHLASNDTVTYFNLAWTSDRLKKTINAM
jgi:hypothetical protein